MKLFLCSSLKGGWRKPVKIKTVLHLTKKKLTVQKSLQEEKENWNTNVRGQKKWPVAHLKEHGKNWDEQCPAWITEHCMNLHCVSNHPSGAVHLLFQKDKLLEDQMLGSTKSRIVHAALWTALAWMLHFSTLTADNTGEVLTKFVNQVTIMQHKHVRYANMIAWIFRYSSFICMKLKILSSLPLLH